MSVRPLLSEIVALKRLHYVDRPSNINLGIIICSFEVFQALQPFPAICSYGTEYTILIDLMTVFDQGRSQDFLKAGGHTGSYRGYSPDCHLNIVCCLLTKKLTKGGLGHSRTPLATPLFLMLSCWIGKAVRSYSAVYGNGNF